MGKAERIRRQPDTARTPEAFTGYARFCLNHPRFSWCSIVAIAIVYAVRSIPAAAWNGARRGFDDAAFRLIVDLDWFKNELRKLKEAKK